MGIHGLSSLINEHKHVLFAEHSLSKCRCVVDGTNACYQLFYAKNIDFAHGGDYAAFRDVCIDFLDIFRRNQVEAVFVFDGFLDPGDMKFATTLSRQKKRLISAQWIAKADHGKLLPIFTVDVFRRIIQSSEFPMLQCISEADSTIASLGRRWNCPVISEDSDFLVFDLPAGYIPFGSLNLTSDTSKGIGCRIYRRERLLKLFPGFNMDTLPLLIALHGNDFSDPAEFSGIYAVLPKLLSGKKKLTRRKHLDRTSSIFAFLSDKNSLQEALESLLPYGGREKMKKLSASVEFNREVYAGQEFSEVPISANLGDDTQEIGKHFLENLEALLELPDWFCRAFIHGQILPELLQIFEQRSLLIPMVEIPTAENVFNLALPIRKLVYAILGQEKVSEYGRIGWKFGKMGVDVDQSFAGFVPLPTLWSAPCLGLPEKLEIFSSLTKNIRLPERFEQNVVFHALTYWIQNSDLASECHLVAILLNLFAEFLREKSRQTELSDDKSFPDFVSELKSYDQESAIQIWQLIRKFGFAPPKIKRTKRSTKPQKLTYLEHVHVFSEWQVTYKAYLWLNQILGAPLAETCVSCIFSGRICCNLAAFFEVYSMNEGLRMIFGSHNDLQPLVDTFLMFYGEFFVPLRSYLDKSGLKNQVKKSKNLHLPDFLMLDKMNGSNGNDFRGQNVHNGDDFVIASSSDSYCSDVNENELSEFFDIENRFGAIALK